MAITVSIEEAQANLREFIRQLAPGSGKGSVLFMSPDFDELLEEMQDYSK